MHQMKIVTFSDAIGAGGDERFRIGVLLDNDLIGCPTDECFSAAEISTLFELNGEWLRLALAAGSKNESSQTYSRSTVRLAAPVPRPGKIICIGLNYRNHAVESGMEIPNRPIIFSKFGTAATGPGAPVMLPRESEQVDYEAELAVVIGRRGRNIPISDAMEHVFGYMNFNDVSARDLQFADGQWQRGKSCDTFAPMGPFVVTRDEVPEPEQLRIRFRLNGETLQDSTTAELIFGVAELIEFISRSITLEPGDVIATGTPPGVGFARKPPIFLKDGDMCEVEIEGLGTLTNPVKSDV